MAILIIGPSSVGKTTILSSKVSRERFELGDGPIVFGSAIDGQAPDNALLHYNLLHPVLDFSDFETANENWSLESDETFMKLMASSKISRAIVMVASVDDLKNRMMQRTEVEAHTAPNTYDKDIWLASLNNLNLFHVYNDLFDLLDRNAIQYDVVHSSPSYANGFELSDPTLIHAILRGSNPKLPEKEAVIAATRLPGSHYQSVLLPHGIRNSHSGYDHIAQGRQASFDAVLPKDMRGDSVLDIGCALGDLLWNAERRGATRLLGIEMHKERFESATLFGQLLSSNAEIIRSDFVKSEISEKFDHVFILNVIHHVWGFYQFLELAAGSAKKTLTIEFPTLNDNKFRSLRSLPLWVTHLANRLPLIGVSGAGADQSHVFSPPAMKALIQEIGGFDKIEEIPSPIKERIILRFTRA